MKQSTDFFVMCRAHLAFYPPGYKFKNKAPQAASFANNVVTADASLDESVNLTRSEYQQLLGLLNSHSHFGTQATLGKVLTHTKLPTLSLSLLSLPLLFKDMRFQVFGQLLLYL